MSFNLNYNLILCEAHGLARNTNPKIVTKFIVLIYNGKKNEKRWWVFLAKGTPVLIYLKTQRNQDGKISDYAKKFQGQLFQIGPSLYLRYLEEENRATVTFKISENGIIQLTRKQADVQMKLYFGNNQRIAALYRTSVGDIPIETITPVLNVTIRDNPLSGVIKIDYLLYNGEELLGDYKLRLQFTA